MLAGFATAYSTKNINDIWGWLTMGLVGGTMIPTVLRLYWWRVNGSGVAPGNPVGLAGAPLRKTLGAEEGAAMAKEHKYDLISLPFAFFWQLTMLMLPLFLIIKQF